jgi:hypothetical protein
MRNKPTGGSCSVALPGSRADHRTDPVVNHQNLVTTFHLPGGEARFVAKGSHGHEGAPGNTRRSEPLVNRARFTYE